MKRLSLLALAALTFAFTVSAHAGTFYYPTKDAPWFTVDIPDGWHPKIEDETLEASAPDNVAYLAFWVLKDKADFANVDKDIADILKDSVTDIKATGEAKEKEVSGIKFTTLDGTGKDKKEKTDVSFEVWMFAPQPGKVGLLYFDRDTTASADIQKALKDIVASIKLKK